MLITVPSCLSSVALASTLRLLTKRGRWGGGSETLATLTRIISAAATVHLCVGTNCLIIQFFGIFNGGHANKLEKAGIQVANIHDVNDFLPSPFLQTSYWSFPLLNHNEETVWVKNQNQTHKLADTLADELDDVSKKVEFVE